jgi:5-methylcytosine-specific restriction protein A
VSPTIRKLCPACKVVLIASPTTRCAACSRAYEQRRGSAWSRGYDARHAAWRKVILATYETCADCGAAGTPSDHADHRVSLAAGGDWSLENGVRRCARCHGRKTARVDGGFGRPRGMSAPGGSQRASQADPTGALRKSTTPLSTGPGPGLGSTDVGTAYAHGEADGA